MSLTHFQLLRVAMLILPAMSHHMDEIKFTEDIKSATDQVHFVDSRNAKSTDADNKIEYSAAIHDPRIPLSYRDSRDKDTRKDTTHTEGNKNAKADYDANLINIQSVVKTSRFRYPVKRVLGAPHKCIPIRKKGCRYFRDNKRRKLYFCVYYIGRHCTAVDS